MEFQTSIGRYGMPVGTIHGAFESTWFIQHLPSAGGRSYVVEVGKLSMDDDLGFCQVKKWEGWRRGRQRHCT